MRILFLYRSGRQARLKELRAGAVPTEFFYGAPELETCGHDIEYIDVHEVPTESKIRTVFEILFKQKFLPVKVNFNVLFGVKKILPKIQNADIVVATVPGIAFSLAIWKVLGVIKFSKPFIAIHCGLFNYTQSFTRKMLSRKLFPHMRTQLFGQGELEKMKDNFAIPESHIEINCFGIDEKYWCPSQDVQRGDYILAVGNDSRRDFELLTMAAGDLTRKVKILTKRKLPENLPGNVEVLYGSWHTRETTDADLRELYRKAFCVVVPLLDSIQPSGQSVTLQAMACGTPVILTRTRGLWESLNLKHGQNVLFTEVANKQNLVETIRSLENNEELWDTLNIGGCSYIMQHGRIGQFADRLESLCHRVAV